MSSGNELLALRWDRARRGGHDDVTVQVGSWIHTCDSYYFALDDSIAGPESFLRTAAVMQALLQQWKEHLTRLAEGDVVSLPFDFSDQWTAWLRAVRTREGIEIQPGWSSRGGWSFAPSNFSDAQPTDWKPIAEAPPVAMTTAACTDAIAHSIAALRSLENSRVDA